MALIKQFLFWIDQKNPVHYEKVRYNCKEFEELMNGLLVRNQGKPRSVRHISSFYPV
jgi:hypothetical protein